MDCKSLTCLVEPFSTAGADVKCSFSVESVVQALNTQLQKRLSKQGMTLVAAGKDAPAGSLTIRGQFVRIDQGNQLLRYLLTFLAGKAFVEVEGQLLRDGQSLASFHFEKRQAGGILGGGGKALTELCAKSAADSIAKLVTATSGNM